MRAEHSRDKAKAVDQETVTFTCPFCKVSWARVTVCFDAVLKAKDFEMLPPYKRSQAGLTGKTGTLNCPACKKKFTGLHIQVMVGQGLYGGKTNS